MSGGGGLFNFTSKSDIFSNDIKINNFINTVNLGKGTTDISSLRNLIANVRLGALRRVTLLYLVRADSVSL